MDPILQQQIAADVAAMRSVLSELQITSAKQEVNLAEHMRRTDAAEERVDTLESFVTETRAYMRSVKVVCVVLVSLVGVAGTVAAIIFGIHSW